jgi:Uma2 family endonuclease
METIILRDRVTNKMSDEEFLWFCQENKDLRIERNSKLEIILMTPVTTKSGLQNGAIFGQLYAWNLRSKAGEVFDSSTGFTLPDRSILSPDASWIANEKFAALSDEEKDRFAAICPDFVIELRSKSDSLVELQNKMISWIKNGVELAWLIDTKGQTSYIYRSKSPDVETIQGFNAKLIGEGLMDGFILDLSLIKL